MTHQVEVYTITIPNMPIVLNFEDEVNARDARNQIIGAMQSHISEGKSDTLAQPLTIVTPYGEITLNVSTILAVVLRPLAGARRLRLENSAWEQQTKYLLEQAANATRPVGFGSQKPQGSKPGTIG